NPNVMTRKRTNFFLSLAGMGLLLVSSCAQEEDIRLDPEGPIWGTPVVKPKGLPLNNGASALIGPDGGSLWYEDLVQLHVPPGAVNEPTLFRSEERRVGKECRARWWPDHGKKRHENAGSQSVRWWNE